MKAFQRVFEYIWPQWHRLVVIFSSAILVGALFSLSFATVLPLLKVMMGEEGLHGWVNRCISQTKYGLRFYVPDRVDLSDPNKTEMSYYLRIVSVEKDEPAEKWLDKVKEIKARPDGAGLGVEIDTNDRKIVIGIKNDLRMDISRDWRRPRYTYEAGKIVFDDFETNGDIVFATQKDGRLAYTIVNLTKAYFKDLPLFEAEASFFGLAFDASPYSGGSLLGDRVRVNMEHAQWDVFFRSMSAGRTMGGLAGATKDAAHILDACGKQIIMIETVGVGQSELDIAQATDTVVVVLVPEVGDTIQILKAGLMEIADIYVVNKADRPGAETLSQAIDTVLDRAPRPKGRRAPVFRTSASVV